MLASIDRRADLRRLRDVPDAIAGTRPHRSRDPSARSRRLQRVHPDVRDDRQAPLNRPPAARPFRPMPY